MSFLYDHFQIKAGNTRYFVTISTTKRKLSRHFSLNVLRYDETRSKLMVQVPLVITTPKGCEISLCI